MRTTRSLKRRAADKEINPLDPRHGECKFYARGVGPVLELIASGGTDRVVLVKIKTAL